MSATNRPNTELFANLSELARDTFPKRCNNCGKTYETVDDFVRSSQNIHPHRSGLKQGYDDDGGVIIELFRNCSCGSTLMDFFHSRRDASLAGVKRRNDFDKLVRQLVETGIEVAHARAEILKWLRGQDSELMKLIKPDS
jgi:hypothetical protein